jgi:imidazolonepropionase-like amidohydrolase
MRYPARLKLVCLVAVLCASAAAAQPQAPPGDTIHYTFLFGDRPAGHMKVWTDEGELVSDFEYNDRGRGPHIVERNVVNSAGMVTSSRVIGHSYYKDSVDERFSYADGTASWKNATEGESSAKREPQFYLSVNGTPLEFALLARALLTANGKQVALFPSGSATVEKVRDLEIGSAASKRTVGLYAISGVGFTPSYVWLDNDKQFFGTVSTWSNVVPKGWEAAVPAMLDAQQAAVATRFESLAKTLAHKPAGALVFRNANVFDAERAVMLPHTTVVIVGNRIQSVGPDTKAKVPAGAEVIDAQGKSLIPGLWDMHVHIQPGEEGLLHLSAGVTSARDMGNDSTNVLDLRRQFDAGTLIGPRLVLAGLIDSPGPFQVPTGVLASTEAEVRKAVNRFADQGFEQIKVYSSLKPELVPVIIDAAHKRGLRVSGHVPASMTAEQVVRLGFDEVQHVNMLMLNFIDSVKDTRAMSRFTAVARDGAKLDFSSQRVRSFLQLLKARHTVLDPTVGTFEDMFVGRPGKVSASFGMVVDRFPSPVARGFIGGGLPVPAGMDQRYRDSYNAMLKMIGEAYRMGIPIVAGTDALPGFALHRELELYVRSGIPAPEVLRIATLGAARVTKRTDKLGTIAPGKLADVILVNGNPATNISDIRKVELTVKDGVVFRSADLLKALSIRP